MRSDAKRNQQRLHAAAIELLLEVGAEPPLDAIARRAGVGIGTLYRHFGDRGSLFTSVAAHVLDQAVAAAERALAEAPDGYDALRTYMHAAVDCGVGVLNLLHPLLDGPDWTAQRARIEPLLDALLERGQREGRIREEVRMPDVVFAVIRFSRPVAMGLPRADERAIAHRHVDIYVDGLGATDLARTPLAELSMLNRVEPG